MRSVTLILVPLIAASSLSQNQFTAPNAKLQYAPDRTFDLKHVVVVTDVDYANRKISGSSTNTLSPLRGGLTELTLHAGTKLEIKSVSVNGIAANFKRNGEDLIVSVAPTTLGKDLVIKIEHLAEKKTGGGFGSEGGWHWIEPRGNDASRIGFWTQGETLYNRNWAVMWDYPNDFATSETVTTVPKDWTVVGNGKLVADIVRGTRRTFQWKMTQPHATYLLSLVGGPFDVKKDVWDGIDLWYVVPKGMGNLIDASFGNTKDMLSFFSNRFGFRYPWPKYAQNAMHDFGGGMENVSSTTLGVGSLTDERSGFYEMTGLNAHELGHQWFGDTVTCRDWGHIWLNESFATFAEACYIEYSRGKSEHERDVEGAFRGFFAEARRYKRPLVTNLYSHPDVMFDSHAYPKGAAILHTMRRMLGDKAFFAGISHYLAKHKYSPVDSHDLCIAMTESTGINLAPFFDQWIYKPGHPVIEYDWSYAAGTITVNVKQVQSTSDGTPIYRIPSEIGVISGGRLVRHPVTLDSAAQTLTVSSLVQPEAVILDPDHDFLREMKHEFADSELVPVFLYGSNAVDREAAFQRIVKAGISPSDLGKVTAMLEGDKARFPVITDTSPLARLKSESLRAFFRKELNHASEHRRASAVRGLGGLAFNEVDEKAIQSLINDREYYVVVVAAIQSLDPKRNREVLEKAAKIPSRFDQIKRAADAALRNSGV